MLQVSSLVALPRGYLPRHAGPDCADSEPIVVRGNSCKAYQLKQVGLQASSVLQKGAKPTRPGLHRIGATTLARFKSQDTLQRMTFMSANLWLSFMAVLTVEL